jgi:hypothetical protein
MTIDVHPLRSRISVVATGCCPFCGGDGWLGAETLATLPQLDAGELETIPFVCAGCGFVRLHAVQALETIDD